MKKRLFQVFDEMNVNDEKNKTATLPCSFTMVEAKSDKRGGIVSMGVEAHILQKIFFGEMQPILVVMDKKEYNRIEKAEPALVPVASTQLPAEVQAEILIQADIYASGKWGEKAKSITHHNSREWDNSVDDYNAGATEFATKLHEAKCLLHEVLVMNEMWGDLPGEYITKVKTFLDGK